MNSKLGPENIEDLTMDVTDRKLGGEILLSRQGYSVETAELYVKYLAQMIEQHFAELQKDLHCVTGCLSYQENKPPNDNYLTPQVVYSRAVGIQCTVLNRGKSAGVTGCMGEEGVNIRLSILNNDTVNQQNPSIETAQCIPLVNN